MSLNSTIRRDDVARLWLRDVRPEASAGRRALFGAERDGHRREIVKMIVHPPARRLGVGRALMNGALHQARALGKTLVALDTRTGDIAEPLYASVGFEVAGVIPDYAWDPDGQAKHATTYMFCRIWRRRAASRG